MDWTLNIGSLSLGIFDLVVLFIALVSFISGFSIGFSRLAFKTFGYVLSFPLSLLFVKVITNSLSSKINISPFWLSLICYVLLCLIFFTLFKLLGNLIGSSFETLHLGWIDGVLGALCSLLIALFILFVLLELFSLQDFVSLMPLKENSVIYKNVYLKIFPSVEKAFKGALLGL